MDKQKQKILDQILLWEAEDIEELLKQYGKKHHSLMKEELARLYSTEMEQKLLENGISTSCPHCGCTELRKRGRDSHNQRYECKNPDCKRSFTIVSETFLEGGNLSWKAWVRIINMLIQNYSLDQMMNVLNREKDLNAVGAHRMTVQLAIHKFLHAVKQLPQPVLKGVIQVDEKHFRESQKASTDLINYLPSVVAVRVPRDGAQSSALGVMSAEYIAIPTCVDEEGYVVAKVACMGKLGVDIFYDLFHEHIKNASILCTDGNPIYAMYSRLFDMIHYIRPSKYTHILKTNGYTFGKNKTPEEIEQNEVILERLYSTRSIDCIINKGYIPYRQFKNIKEKHKLSLSRVNAFHNKIEEQIKVHKRSVASKHLDKYISFYVFIHNWKVKHGAQPSSIVDAEEILLYVLKNTNHTTYTLKDYKNEVLDIPKPTDKYHNLLAAMTSTARKEFNNKYLKFNEEDKVYSFDKRKYLSDCPDSWIKGVAREHGIPVPHKFVKFSVISKILQLEDINSVMVKLLLNERHIHIDAEDMDLLDYFGITDLSLDLNTPLDEQYAKHLPAVREDSPLYNPNIYPTVEQVEAFEAKRLENKRIKKEVRNGLKTPSEIIKFDDEEDGNLPF